jgi:hypothetical protein
MLPLKETVKKETVKARGSISISATGPYRMGDIF